MLVLRSFSYKIALFPPFRGLLLAFSLRDDETAKNLLFFTAIYVIIKHDFTFPTRLQYDMNVKEEKSSIVWKWKKFCVKFIWKTSNS
jgi:hypothetical protein